VVGLEDEREDGRKELLLPEIEKCVVELRLLGPTIVMRPKRRVDSRETTKKQPDFCSAIPRFESWRPSH
jgi:hypothetical protein